MSIFVYLFYIYVFKDVLNKEKFDVFCECRSNLVKQRVCLKFCVLNKISCANEVKMLKERFYRISCMLKIQSYEWYKMIQTSQSQFYSRFKSQNHGRLAQK